MKWAVLVVTYNKKECLKKTLSRLYKQKFKPSIVLVVDNHSTDGTAEFLNQSGYQLHSIRTDKNIGGAGAYNLGLKWCVEQGADWIWCLEDDMPAPIAFLEHANKWIEKQIDFQRIGFVYPTVLSVHNRHRPDTGIYKAENEFIDGSPKLNKAQFGSLLVNADAVREIGLPIKEFFIYGDDWEFTSRMVANNWSGVWLKDLFVWHLHESKPTSKPYLYGRIDEMWKFYFGIRNELSVYRKKNLLLYFKLLFNNLIRVPLLVLLYRKNNRLSVAFSWVVWSIKSIFLQYKIDYISDFVSNK